MLQTSQSDYTSILSEFLQKQVVIFGSQVVQLHLAHINGLHMSGDGLVKKIEGDAQMILEQVVKALSELSEFAVKRSLDSVVLAHTKTQPKQADISHLPSTQTQILKTIPVAQDNQS